LGKKILILGDVGSGKTRLTAEILRGWVSLGYGGIITVVDLGPDLEGVGRPLEIYLGGLTLYRYLRPKKIFAPRLMARDAESLLRYVSWNYEESKRLFRIYSSDPSEILVVNDISIFLHKGDVSELRGYIGLSGTFLGNAYHGNSIVDRFGVGIDGLERERVEELAGYMDVVIEMGRRD
jgi:GTPase SAR1 family protein